MIFLEFEKPLASLYEQLEKLKEIGEAGDIDVSSQISVFEEKISGGKKNEERPELMKMIHFIKNTIF